MEAICCRSTQQINEDEMFNLLEQVEKDPQGVVWVIRLRVAGQKPRPANRPQGFPDRFH
jgi:ribosome-associated toxin RatA of RatAB toxin-antitoxin module